MGRNVDIRVICTFLIHHGPAMCTRVGGGPSAKTSSFGRSITTGASKVFVHAANVPLLRLALPERAELMDCQAADLILLKEAWLRNGEGIHPGQVRSDPIGTR